MESKKSKTGLSENLVLKRQAAK
jgi:WD40 repeat protein